MNRSHRTPRAAIQLFLALATVGTAPALEAQPATAVTRPATTEARWAQANVDWTAGDYVRALTGLGSVLRSPDANDFRERVALLTGENWPSVMVAENARAPRWSPDGSHIAFDVALGAERVTRIAKTNNGFASVADVRGSDVVFAPNGARIAFLTTKDDDVSVMTRDLSSGREAAIPLPGLVPAQVAFEPSGALLVVAARTGGARTALYRVPAGGAAVQVSRIDSVVADLVLSTDGAFALYGIGGRSPVQIGTGRGFARGPARTQFALLDLSSGVERVITGESPVLSANGRAIAFLTHAGDTTTVQLGALGNVAREVHRTTDALEGLAVSPDGRHVTFQQRPREDWELYSTGVDGGEPVRLTREIQHDLMPQYLDNERVLAVIGEARHRRSHLYVGGKRYRLFHNNTVRTIAPEYEWVPSPDGTKLLIVAERDGDTVTPHRHLFMMDLQREVTVPELIARVDTSLVEERRLRTAGARAFAPIMADVRRAVGEVSTNRVFAYAQDLFAFDSKHITQPGNAKARAYLADTYRGFGYTDVRTQEFAPQPNLSQPAIPTANILAVLPGTTHPELVYVVSSHFDSRATGPGADDNTSGTSALLEAARVLASRPQAATIIFASFTGEESGLLGSREFVRQAKESGLQLVGALNNDMVGWANDERLDNTIRYSNPGIRDLQHAAAIEFTNLITYDAFYYKSTDAQAFYDGYGDVVGGIGSYPVLGNPHYHQPHDVLETINHQLVAEVAKTTVATLMYLASSPSRLADLTARQNGAVTEVQWQASREKDVERYRVQWGPESDPTRHRMETTTPNARLENAPAGTVVMVRAINARSLEGWDWARAVVGATPQ